MQPTSTNEALRGRPDHATPPNDAHPWSATWCELLGRILAGRAAADLERELAGRAVGVVVLPSFVLVDPKLDLGRKALARGGRRLRFPARVIWTDLGDRTGQSVDGHDAADHLGAVDPELYGIGPTLLAATGAERRVAWEAVGVGVRVSGTTTICASQGTPQSPSRSTVALEPIPEAVVVAASTRRAATDELQRLVLDGQDAFWQARQMLERHGDWVLRRRLAAVTAEIAPGEGERLLDETDLEVVRDELLLGDAERRISPAYDRIIERCLAPGAFARVDPQHRVMRSLRSTTETALRRRIGDPHVGRKVRQLVSEEPLESLDELIARYGERWPKDRLGVRRIEAALSVKGAVAPVPASDLDALRQGESRRTTRLARSTR